MSPHEFSEYITHLLRSEAEIIAAFLTGAFFAALVILMLRRWVFPARASDYELAKKDAEIARKEVDIAKRDAQIAKIEAKLGHLEGKLLERIEHFTNSPAEHAAASVAPATPAAPPPDYTAAKTRCAQLEADNAQLAQHLQSQEQTIARLRTELTQATGELAHMAKWLRLIEEENAQLTETDSLVNS
jgi:septal ring factor EnvC (AmiA/AmiB activator)